MAREWYNPYTLLFYPSDLWLSANRFANGDGYLLYGLCAVVRPASRIGLSWNDDKSFWYDSFEGPLSDESETTLRV